MAQNTRYSILDKPMNVEEIVKIASQNSFDPQFSMQHYFRTADLMMKQANIYEHEGNDQMAYFLLYRHANLLLKDLYTHPHAKEPRFKDSWTNSHKSAKKSLAKLESLKPKINKKYAKSLEKKKSQAAKPALPPRSPGYQPYRPTSNDDANHSTESLSGDRLGSSRDSSPRRLDPTQNRDVAVELANNEIKRRTTVAQQSPRQDVDDGREAQSRMVYARSQMEPSVQMPDPSNYKRRSRPSSSSAYSYPTIPHKSRTQDTNGYERLSRGPSSLELDQPQQMNPPQRPPKELPNNRDEEYLHRAPPAIPSKERLSPSHSPSPQQQPPPLPSRSPSKQAYTGPPIPSKLPPTPPSPPSKQPVEQFTTPSRLESGVPLRTIFLPQPLRHKFTSIASTNTSKNIETCGILVGTLLRNAFFITKLLIPEQVGTSDTVEMVNEEDLHAYIDAPENNPGGGDLMVLGWIHTHPSQTCFMSSRDLHTHVWYQVSLPESIAIVCSPRKSPDWGVFRLTDPPGLGTVRDCRKEGVFHLHDEIGTGGEGGIYTDCVGRPGHVVEVEGLEFECVDLRGK